ncbi:MAG: tRNA uridine-5-carboxymethylaminomethyl(34) synthesis GTPase MnmE [Helicobacter sp.]|nr:tRNA uridine-5-carboxymethylaminomethyl(34) synthesis GTPase MnmE [Helicobacter sp.]
MSTIVGIATGDGVGGIAIVRLSGQGVLEIAKKLTKREVLKPRYASLCSIYYGKDLLDLSIVIYYKAPKSFTGEDVVEIQCHGGLIIARSIVKASLNLGATLAKAGDFTKRAILNNRMDLAQAFVMLDMIHAKSEQDAKLLARQLKGSLGEFINECRRNLIGIIAICEALIDYAEDMESDAFIKLDATFSALLTRFCNILEFSNMRKDIARQKSICIIGKPNVGKSSLLNALTLEDRAIVSPLAGTTRDLIKEEILLNGSSFVLADTAGIRSEVSDEIENIGIKKALDYMHSTDLILLLVDGSIALESSDLDIFDKIKNFKNVIVVKNKIDKGIFITDEALQNILPNALKIIEISTKNESSIIALKNEISKIVDIKLDREEFLLTRDFQIQAIESVICSLNFAKKCLENSEIELLVYHANEAINALGLITKPYEIGEMFDAMFSEFCLGK